MELKGSTVTIVGLGLMGGSLAAALRKRQLCQEVVGVSRSEASCRTAEELGYVGWATRDLVRGVQKGNLVILATPVRTILRLLPEVAAAAAPGTVILDLGSTKAQILEAMAALPAHVEPVGGHPMCGREASGIAAALPDLYEGAAFVLSAPARTSAAARQLVQSLVEKLGSRPIWLEPGRHDELVAAISHLPYLLAVGLTRQVRQTGLCDHLVWELAAGGFRDASRLAASDETMMLDILLTNREPVMRVVREAVEELKRLGEAVERGEGMQLADLLQQAAQARKGWRR